MNRKTRIDVLKIFKKKYFDPRFKKVAQKDLIESIFKSLEDFFPGKHYSFQDIEIVLEREEQFFLPNFRKKYYSLLLNKKLLLNRFPKYVDKEHMSNLIKEELKKCIKTGEPVDLIDIYIQFQEESNLKALQKEEEIKKLKTKAAIEDVQNFYTNARKKKRQIIFHSGPTNSGKTYNAIQQFKKAKKGLYLAPLRLLAREIYDSCNDLNISLITGEEIIKHKEETHISSTIEMVDFNQEYDIAIIDEIQMIEDPQRGAAWSRALMGVNANIVYVIGSSNAKPIIQKIVEKCGDSFKEIKHERLSTLTPVEEPLPFRKLEKGDAIICFSRKDIYLLKELVESFNFSTALVYGSLPPSTRLTQAELFNKGERDILIATDAIGYGLNLNIKRIIFSTLIKFNGTENTFISDSLFKQIAGRAGRYGKHENGEVRFLKKERRIYYEDNIFEFREYTERLSEPLMPIQAGIFFPEYIHLQEFSQVKDYKNQLAKIIKDYESYFIDKSGLFHMTDIEDFLKNAEILDKEGTNLSLEDKYKLSFAPFNKKSNIGKDIYITFIKYLQGSNIPRFEEFYSIKNLKKESLLGLEFINKDLSLYIWLGYRVGLSQDYINQLIDLYENISERITLKLEEKVNENRKF